MTRRTPAITKSVTAEAELVADSTRELSAAIAQTRRAAGLTQREVAEAMGTKQAFVAHLESGRTLPSTRTLQKFAEATNHRLRIGFVQEHPRHRFTKENQTMTDTLIRPSSLPYALANRRHVLGGAIGLAGLLGLGRVKHVTAQEATAAASASADYVWTPPAYDPEPALFTVLDRNDQTVTVETIDGQIEAPTNPQRVVALGWEYISLFELGVADRLIGIGYGEGYESPLSSAGELTEAMHVALTNVTLIPNPWELDIEQVVTLNTDLILTNPWWPEDPTSLARIAPVIRGKLDALGSPRAAVRDFGELFSRSDVVTNLIAEHEAFVERARQAAAPVATGRKALALMPGDGTFYAEPSYYVWDDGIHVNGNGAYHLHRELGITPSSFIEHLADDDDRQSGGLTISMEQIGEVDADYLFVLDNDGSFDAFVNHPLVQQTVAGQRDQIYPYNIDRSGWGLAGVRAEIALILEQITGEPFA